MFFSWYCFEYVMCFVCSNLLLTIIDCSIFITQSDCWAFFPIPDVRIPVFPLPSREIESEGLCSRAMWAFQPETSWRGQEELAKEFVGKGRFPPNKQTWNRDIKPSQNESYKVVSWFSCLCVDAHHLFLSLWCFFRPSFFGRNNTPLALFGKYTMQGEKNVQVDDSFVFQVGEVDNRTIFRENWTVSWLVVGETHVFHLLKKRVEDSPGHRVSICFEVLKKPWKRTTKLLL